MILDKEVNIPSYRKLLTSLSALEKLLPYPVESQEEFTCDKKNSTLIIIKKGSFSVATSWRELENSKDVTSAFLVNEGDALLFLPGEHYLIKGEGNAIKYLLES